jgi:PhzF family phenazine biosynthesis protein
MPETQIYHIDAFTSTPFKGNPTVICMMPTSLSDELYLSITREMNLSVTTFLEKSSNIYKIRWFTPQQETPLCGYATLAAAHIIYEHLEKGEKRIEFTSLSGSLYAEKTNSGIMMDFPINRSSPIDPPKDVLRALGVKEPVAVQYNESNKRLIIQLKSEEEVHSLKPDFAALLRVPNALGWRGVVVTALGRDYDFVSRHFAPFMGIDEDPVTGSTHTVLGPYWSGILGKAKMSAYQDSARGGEMLVEVVGDRVLLTGNCVTIFKGLFTY